jgi:hypothetical protein
VSKKIFSAAEKAPQILNEDSLNRTLTEKYNIQKFL